ncbi:MAG: arginine--tRNA ligase [Coxiellaceae bacterium]|jgi:arginyl-tRNA synthetase|nr:arginine--tRNA ligase [Coxiellaceae bacterium]
MQVTITKALEQKFSAAFQQLGFDKLSPVVLKESSRPEFGDYQVNGIMALAKEHKVNARELAAQVIAKVNYEKVIAKLEVAGPGFINITLSNEYLNQRLTKELLDVTTTLSHTIIVDYSSPNLAKEMHVGHLRSSIIGDALVRLYEYLGHRVIRRNHVGDWGTQFGMLVAYLSEAKSHNDNLDLALSDLEEFYRKAKARFDEDKRFADRAREYVVKLQAKDPEIIYLWQQFINMSLNHCQKIYDRLHTKLTPEDAVGESAYNDLLSIIVEDLLAKKVAVNSNGAKCIFFGPGELDVQSETPFIIQKKDGAYLYATTDIAAIYDRIKNLHADYLVYVVDVRQSLHFQQLFATVKKAGIVKPETTLKHVAFGTMLGEDNKPFKTRSGGTVKLTSLTDEAVERAATLVRKRNPVWLEPEINELAEMLGIAAIKYADLSKNRVSDYIFDFDQMLAFEGNTAPYMLYAYVRINSIFKKADLIMENYLDQPIVITEKAEHDLALHLVKFADRLLQAEEENYPHYICAYIYELARLFMRFYEICPMIKASDQTHQTSRLALSALTAEVLKVSLDLLGITVVGRM